MTNLKMLAYVKDQINSANLKGKFSVRAKTELIQFYANDLEMFDKVNMSNISNWNFIAEVKRVQARMIRDRENRKLINTLKRGNYELRLGRFAYSPEQNNLQITWTLTGKLVEFNTPSILTIDDALGYVVEGKVNIKYNTREPIATRRRNLEAIAGLKKVWR